MEVTYKNLGLVNFPIFGLQHANVSVEDGLLRDGGFVIDDRNQIGDNIGSRRLQCPHKLAPLKTMYHDIGGLLRAKHNVFIDYKGYVFIYKKTKFAKIIYHKINEVIYKDVCCLLKVAHVPFPIEVKRPPPAGKTWVGMLFVDGHPWLPYEYSDSYCSTLRRKI